MMTEYQITKAVANRVTDVLSVEAIALDIGKIITAQGWVSAMSNYYPDDAYTLDDGGNLTRDESIEPRAMDSDERKAYIVGLVQAMDIRPPVVETPEPVEEDLSDLFN